VDLLEPALVADPHPHLRALREHDPVHWSDAHRAWLVLRHDDVIAGFRDPAFSSEGVVELPPGTGVRGLSSWMAFRDPPQHTRLRKLAQKAFTPRVAEKLRPRVQEIVDELLDDLASEGGGDFVQSFASPLPAIVIAEMLGVPPDDRDKFAAWSHDIKGVVFGMAGAARGARAWRGFEALEEYFEALLERFRRTPEDNLLSAIATAEDRGDLLSADEIVGTCVLLLFGGHETTTNLLSSGLLALLRHPEERHRLDENPGLWRSAVEELLRFEGPMKLVVRRPREARSLRGHAIQPGERVFLVQAAANRDPNVFPDPDRLDVGRDPNPHVAFGHGLHFCMGAPLARMEAEVALATLLARYPDVQVTTDVPEYEPAILSRSLARLPIKL
jgi:cytochrome P450